MEVKASKVGFQYVHSVSQSFKVGNQGDNR
jgi:hypothetical protein